MEPRAKVSMCHSALTRLPDSLPFFASRIRAGASAVQLYSALAYEGPPLVGCIKRELAQLFEEDGFSCVAEAVGSACRAPGPGGKN